jgi:ribonuclease Z
MRPRFYSRLVNGPFEDPALFVACAFEKRALLFDLGDIHRLPARELLKISHIFVSHTHIDHFIGFDQLLRLLLGREKCLHLFGPEDFIRNVRGHLAGYSWNLVENFTYRLSLRLTEVHADCQYHTELQCRDRFLPTLEPSRSRFDGVLMREPGMVVSTAVLDHGLPCLGFRLEERFHVNIISDALDALGLAPGPWLSAFKQALYSDLPPDTPMAEICPGHEVLRAGRHRLGRLAERIAAITPGQKIAYITDAGFTPANQEQMLKLARNVDHLFIEAAFLDRERSVAARKHHLTALQAGLIAARSQAKQFSVFHFSPRYRESAHMLREEALRGFTQGLEH